MPTVPQMPLPKKQQPAPGQETSDNISEMRGSFRQAAAEASTRIMKKTFGTLFSALRFKEKQEDYSDETRKNFQGVTDSLDSVSDKVGYAVSILQDINGIQLKSLRFLRDILDNIGKNKKPSLFDKLPKTLLNLLKIAGLAGLALARSRIGGLASRVLLGADALNTLDNANDSIKKNIQPIEPMAPDALAPKSDAKESDGGGGDDEEEEDPAPQLTALSDEFEKYVLGDEKLSTGEDATATQNQGQTPVDLSALTLNQTTTNITPPIVNQTSVNVSSPNINQTTTANILPTNINQTTTANILPTNINQTTQLNNISTNVPVNVNQLPGPVAVNKENVSATITKTDQQNGMAELAAKNQIDAASKLTRSLVFSSDTITFSADEIEFIQKKIENVKSEELEKLSNNEEEDFHKREPKSKTGSEQDGAPGGPGTTPQGPAGKNPGDGSTPFNGQLNPELGEIRTKSGLTTKVAKDMVPKFQGFVSDLESTGYQIRELGGYANRMNVNNPSVPSAHAYGAAIDINPSTNPNQSRQTDMPREQVQNLIQKHGLGWGLNWQSLGDPMHFSAMPNEGGTGSPTSTMTPNQSGGGMGGGSAGDTSGGGGGGGGAAASPMSKESATPGASAPSSTPSSSGGSTGAGTSSSSSTSSSSDGSTSASATGTISTGGTAPSMGSTTTSSQATATPSTPPPANLTPLPVDTGFKIDKMSQSVSPLRPRASLDQIIGGMSSQEKPNGKKPLSFYDPSKSLTSDPTNAGNVEPHDADRRIQELFGDYSSLGNAGSLG